MARSIVFDNSIPKRLLQVGGRCQSIHLQAPSQSATKSPAGRDEAPSSPEMPLSSQPRASEPEGSFRFDTGPSLLLFPNTYKETYRSLGHDMASHLEV